MNSATTDVVLLSSIKESARHQNIKPQSEQTEELKAHLASGMSYVSSLISIQEKVATKARAHLALVSKQPKSLQAGVE